MSYLTDKKPPLPLCIILTIVFCPIGLWLLYLNLTFDKTKLEENSKIARYYGYMVLGIGLLCLLLVPRFARITTEENGEYFMNIAVVIMTFSGNRAFSNHSKELLEKRVRVNKIKELIASDTKYLTLENLAKEMGITYKVLLLEMKDLIAKGFFPGAKIDENTKKLLL